MDRAYTAGLLHAIGRLGLLVSYPREYAAMLRDSDKPQALLAREVELFGVDHCESGQFLIEQWGLPSDFGLIAGHHHEKPTSKSSEWHKASYLACQMADSLGFSVVKPCQAPEFDHLCKQLPPATRRIFQAQAEVLRAVIDLGISTHDFTDSTPPEPAVRGVDPEELSSETPPEPTADPEDLQPPRFDRPPSTRIDWEKVAGAATVALLVAFSIAVSILIR